MTLSLLSFFITLTKVSFAYQNHSIYDQDIPDEIAFFDIDHNRHFLEQFDDKTILLSFWASWCSSCLSEINNLDNLQKDFRKLPFQVIAISEDFKDVEIVKSYFQHHDIKYLRIYYDYKNALFKSFSVAGLPTSFLINTNGKIVEIFTGNTNWNDDDIREIILSHMNGNYSLPRNSHKTLLINQNVKSLLTVPKNSANQDQIDDNTIEK
ncbi:MAG: TlpA disulfide reductase family protein [Rickettsiaceae bacterium]